MKTQKKEVNKKKLINTLISLGLVLGGLVLIALGVVSLKNSGIMDLFSNLMGAFSGNAEGGGVDISTLISSLVKAVGLIVGGIILLIVGLGIYRSYRKKEQKELQTKAEAQALLAEMQWQQPPAPLEKGGPASLETVSVPIELQAEQVGDHWECPTCHKEVQKGYNVCPFCATHLTWETNVKRCAQCGNELKAGMAFCPYCGIVIPQEDVSAPETATAQAQSEEAVPAASLPQEEKRCFYCGATIKADEDECPVCHHKFVKQTINSANIDPEHLK